jgi:hypothetical protein
VVGIQSEPGKQDPTRGTGPDKATEAATPDLNAPPNAQTSEPDGSSEADPAGGGCMRFGWGCLPVLGGVMILPALLY